MGWFSNLFESSYKKERDETIKSAKKQAENFAEETKDISDIHSSQIKSFDAAISESYDRLEKLMKENDEKRSQKLQEIEKEAEIHQRKLDEEMEKYKSREAEIEKSSKDEMAKFRESSKSEKMENIVNHKELIAKKQEELTKLRSSHVEKMKVYKEEQLEFMKSREDQILEFIKNLEVMKTDHFDVIQKNMEELKLVKLKNLDRKLELLQLEQKSQQEKDTQLMGVQYAQIMSEHETSVGTELNKLLPMLKHSIEAIEKVQSTLSDVQKNTVEADDLLERAKYEVEEWKTGASSLASALIPLKRVVQFCPPIDKGFRTKVNNTIHSIEMNNMDTSSLPRNVQIACKKKDHLKLDKLADSISKQLEFLKSVRDDLNTMMTPENRTLKILMDQTSKIENSTKMLERNGSVADSRQ